MDPTEVRLKENVSSLEAVGSSLKKSDVMRRPTPRKPASCALKPINKDFRLVSSLVTERNLLAEVKACQATLTRQPDIQSSLIEQTSFPSDQNQKDSVTNAQEILCDVINHLPFEGECRDTKLVTPEEKKELPYSTNPTKAAINHAEMEDVFNFLDDLDSKTQATAMNYKEKLTDDSTLAPSKQVTEEFDDWLQGSSKNDNAEKIYTNAAAGLSQSQFLSSGLLSDDELIGSQTLENLTDLTGFGGVLGHSNKQVRVVSDSSKSAEQVEACGGLLESCELESYDYITDGSESLEGLKNRSEKEDVENGHLKTFSDCALVTTQGNMSSVLNLNCDEQSMLNTGIENTAISGPEEILKAQTQFSNSESEILSSPVSRSEKEVFMENKDAFEAVACVLTAEAQMENPQVSDPESNSISPSSHCPEKTFGSKDENLEFAEDEFKDAAQVFDDPGFFDMLEKSKSSKDANLKRGSVLLKFDPLQEKRESAFAVPKNPSPVAFFKPALNETKNNSPSDSICLFGTPPKVSRRRMSNINRHRMNTTNVPCIEEETPGAEVDLIFDSDCTDGMDTILQDNLFPSSDPQLIDIGKIYKEQDVEEIKCQLNADLEAVLLKKDKEFNKILTEKTAEFERQLLKVTEEKELHKKALQKEKKKAASKETKLNELCALRDDCEKLILEIQGEKETALSEANDIVSEKAKIQKDIKQMEEDNKEWDKSFQDLYQRYKKVNECIDASEKNISAMEKACAGAEEESKANLNKAKKIKEVAEAKIAELDTKCKNLAASNQEDFAKYEASIKRKDIQIQGLESSIEQKIKENKELTEICDSLLNKSS